MHNLECQNLSLSYEGGDAIVRNVDYQVLPSSLTIVVGANGCGKSTLMKGLSRTLPATSGSTLLNGQDILSYPSKKVAQILGLLPQSPSCPEGLTVRELVALGRFPHQKLWGQNPLSDDAVVDEAMALANVSDFAFATVDSLSGGQRQRCWIAMILAQQTPILLLDEPTTYLDMKVQIDLMHLLQSLAHEHGRSVCVVLHELNLAAAYADHLVMMKSGEIFTEGDPKTVLTEQNLKAVFDLDARVLIDPDSERPHCLPKTLKQANAHVNKPKARKVSEA